MTVPISINNDQGYNRLDNDHYVGIPGINSTVNSIKLLDCGAEIRRGKFYSSQIPLMPFPIMHSCDFPKRKQAAFVMPAELRLTGEHKLPPGLVIAEPNDILIARVDRNLERKVITLAEGRAAISDSIFRIRTPSKHHVRVAAFFHSDLGSKFIAALSRGVGARSISMKSILNTPIPSGGSLSDD